MKKRTVLGFLLVLTASSLILVNLVSASVTKPSVPEFTVWATDHSYDIQTTTTTTTDFDGRKITTTTPGYHLKNGSIELSIKNQPFTTYYDPDGYPISLYYRIRVRGSDSVNWQYAPDDNSYFTYVPGDNSSFQVNNSTHTTFTFSYSGDYVSLMWGQYTAYRSDGTVDFQVEAFIGHTNTTYRPTSAAPIIMPQDLIVKYVGQTSGWSNAQTVTIPNGSYTPTPPTTPSTSPSTPPDSPPPSQDSESTPQEPTVPQGTNNSETANESVQTASLIVIGVGIALVLAGIGLLAYSKKRINHKGREIT